MQEYSIVRGILLDQRRLGRNLCCKKKEKKASLLLLRRQTSLGRVLKLSSASQAGFKSMTFDHSDVVLNPNSFWRQSKISQFPHLKLMGSMMPPQKPDYEE